MSRHFVIVFKYFKMFVKFKTEFIYSSELRKKFRRTPKKRHFYNPSQVRFCKFNNKIGLISILSNKYSNVHDSQKQVETRLKNLNWLPD